VSNPVRSAIFRNSVYLQEPEGEPTNCGFDIPPAADYNVHRCRPCTKASCRLWSASSAQQADVIERPAEASSTIPSYMWSKPMPAYRKIDSSDGR
jgi:hypothetical protein